MAWKQCEFIHAAGRQCGAPAMRGTSFCHHHRRRQLKPAAAYIPDLTDPRSVSVALGEIMRAMLTNRISSEDGGRILFAMQMVVAENKKLLKEQARRRTKSQERATHTETYSHAPPPWLQ
jgi:hypothetical protein